MATILGNLNRLVLGRSKTNQLQSVMVNCLAVSYTSRHADSFTFIFTQQKKQ